MALGGGSLSLSQIRGEFGGGAPDSMSEYYAGGSLVPSGTSGTNGAVPSSGAIAFSKFNGTSNRAPAGSCQFYLWYYSNVYAVQGSSTEWYPGVNGAGTLNTAEGSWVQTSDWKAPVQGPSIVDMRQYFYGGANSLANSGSNNTGTSPVPSNAILSYIEFWSNFSIGQSVAGTLQFLISGGVWRGNGTNSSFESVGNTVNFNQTGSYDVYLAPGSWGGITNGEMVSLLRGTMPAGCIPPTYLWFGFRLTSTIGHQSLTFSNSWFKAAWT